MGKRGNKYIAWLRKKYMIEKVACGLTFFLFLYCKMTSQGHENHRSCTKESGSCHFRV